MTIKAYDMNEKCSIFMDIYSYNSRKYNDRVVIISVENTTSFTMGRKDIVVGH